MSWTRRFTGVLLFVAAALGAGLCAERGSAQQSYVGLSPGKQLLEANPDLVYDPFSVLVRFAPGAGKRDIQAALDSVGGEVMTEYTTVPGLYHISIETTVDKAIVTLLGSQRVLYAEPDWIVRTHAIPNDSNFGSLWGMRNTGQTVNSDPGIAGADTRAYQAWDVFAGDQNFVIAIIDDGTNKTHPDLAANIWSNPGEIAGNGLDDDGNGFVDDTWGYDFYQNDNDPSNTKHGTHTAGTVGAVGNNGTGVAGVMWRCSLMALRFIGPAGGATSDAIRAVQYATTEGVKVSNNSWGGGGFSQGLYDAIAASRSVGHLFVASAGNNGTNNDTTASYPASYTLDNIISVAATDNNDGLASFSNYGASSVDIGAPGVNILSCYGTSGYSYLNGTSMAGPHVAGAVALVYSANPSYSYTQVRNRILSTARAVGSLAGRCATGGVLNIAAALGGSAPNTAPTVTITAPGSNASFTAGSAITFSGSSNDTQDGSLTAGMNWSSSLQGALGTGGSFSRSDLIVGTHTITASSTDSGSLTGTASVTITVTDPTATPPAAPSGVSVTGGAGSATVSWVDNSSNETSFEIKRQTRVGNSWSTEVVVGSVGANVTQFVNSVAAGKHRYAVRAVNAAGTSAWSAWVQVTVN